MTSVERNCPVGPRGLARCEVGGPRQGPGGFQRILEEKVAEMQETDRSGRFLGGLRVSAHAQKRLEMSGVDLMPQQVDQIAKAVDLAARKGARESLVLMDDLALLVSVRNRTLITAIDMQRVKENIFTNIDSTVIVRGKSGCERTQTQGLDLCEEAPGERESLNHPQKGG